MTRTELTAAILAGFCANPNIFGRNATSGWGLVNCTDAELVGYARHLADNVLEATQAQNQTPPTLS
jgi:hypothetical protein